MAKDGEDKHRDTIARHHITVGAIAKILVALIKWGAIVWIVYMAGGAAAPFAGKFTGIDASAKLEIPGIASALKEMLSTCIIVGLLGLFFGISGVLFGRKESRIRRMTVEKMHQYQLLWEKNQDAGRTSSTLTPSGDTRPEDD